MLQVQPLIHSIKKDSAAKRTIEMPKAEPNTWEVETQTMRLLLEAYRYVDAAFPKTDTTYLYLSITTRPAYESSTIPFKLVNVLPYDKDILIDEPLVAVPLKVQPIKLRIRYRGKGKTILQSNTEFTQYTDEE